LGRRLSDRIARHPALRENRRRIFLHSWPTAPAAPRYASARGRYRWLSMTRRACVIGWPVEHSRSPVIHRYWLNEYGIDGAYEKEAVKAEHLDRFLRELSDHGYGGANVTLPHKEAALRAAAAADAAAL